MQLLCYGSVERHLHRPKDCLELLLFLQVIGRQDPRRVDQLKSHKECLIMDLRKFVAHLLSGL